MKQHIKIHALYLSVVAKWGNTDQFKWDWLLRIKYGDRGTGRNMDLLRKGLAATNYRGKNYKIIKSCT